MKRIMAKKKKRAAEGLLAVCLAVSLAGCGQAAPEEILEDFVYAKVQEPARGELVLQNEFVGSISPEEAVYVVPLVSAEVLDTKVEVGDRVNAGDILCVLDSEAARMQLESAQASYESAQASANSTLGGQMALQDLQTANSISQLEKQLDDLNENLTDSQNDYTDSSNSLDDVSDWKDDAKDSFEDAAEEYYAAEALYNKFKELQSSAGGKVFAGMSLAEAADQAADIVKDYKTAEGMYEGAKATLKKYIEESGKTEGDLESGADPGYVACKAAVEDAKTALDNLDKAEYDAAITAIGLRQAAKSAGVSADDVSQSGLSKLSSKMSTAQSEYTNASTQKATLEAQKDGYDNAVEQLEDNLSILEDNLKAARDTAMITETQIKPETQALMDAQLNAAGLGIKSAQMQLDMYTLTTPIGGVVESVNITEHSFASAGNAAFVISNKETMTATFTVSEAIRNTLSVGQNISVDRNGTVYPATITEIGSMVDAATGLFQIKASVEADGNSLLTGSSVKITADTYRAEDVLLLPYDAVYYESGQGYVYVLENGVAARKDVVTGIFNEDTISVLSGLSQQDRIITTWASNLREGVTVQVQEEGTEEVK